MNKRGLGAFSKPCHNSVRHFIKGSLGRLKNNSEHLGRLKREWMRRGIQDLSASFIHRRTLRNHTTVCNMNLVPLMAAVATCKYYRERERQGERAKKQLLWNLSAVPYVYGSVMLSSGIAFWMHLASVIQMVRACRFLVILLLPPGGGEEECHPAKIGVGCGVGG